MTKLIRSSDQACVADQLRFADSYLSRLRGLIGTKKFAFGQGLLFPRCNSAHMWMMSIPIDLVFLKINSGKTSKEWTVLSVHSHLKPWKPLPVTNLKADDMLELPAGMAQSISLKSGEVLCIV